MAGNSKSFNYYLSIKVLPPEGNKVEIKASPEECLMIANNLDLINITSFESVLEVKPDKLKKDAIRVIGRLFASVTERCVVTLDSFSSDFDHPVEALFVLGQSQEIDNQLVYDIDEEIVDYLDKEEEINLGKLLVDHLSLGLDPYPRKPGINKDKLINEYGPNKNIKFDDSQDRPFAVLGQLRRKM